MLSVSNYKECQTNEFKVLLHMIPVQEGMEFVVNEANILFEKNVSKINFFEKCIKIKRDFENQANKRKYFHLFLPFLNQDNYDMGYSTISTNENLIYLALFNFTNFSSEKFIENYYYLIKATNDKCFFENNDFFITTNKIGHSNYSII